MATPLTPLRHALKNLRRKPSRSAILIAAIGLLVSVLVFALSFVRRVDAGIRRTSERLGADLIVVPTGSRGAAEDVLLENRVSTFYMDRSVADRVRAIPGVERVTAQTYLATIGGECCDVPETMVVMFDQDSDFVVAPWLGKRIGRRLEKGEAIVGSQSALNIDLGLTRVDAFLFGNVFRMVGVLERTGTGLDTAVFIDRSNLEDVRRKGKVAVRPDSVSVVFVRAAEGADPEKIAAVVENTIVEADAVSRRDIGRNVLRSLADIGRMFLLTFLLASILAACLAWAVFSGVANERAREVGIMRAIGAKQSHVVRLFLLEVVAIGGVGSLLGVAAGTALTLALARSFSILEKASAGLGLLERAGIGASGLVIGTGICLLGALAPIRRAGRTEPLLVLKGD
jgi:putative ABC transport system permease protein